MITASLLTLAALWLVVLHRFPAYFVPRKPTLAAQDRLDGENWIEVHPIQEHREVASLQQVG